MNGKKLYNFVKGGNDALRPMKREQLFMQLLEGLHPDEAEIIVGESKKSKEEI